MLAKNTSIILGDHFDTFLKAEVASGRYASVSEVIRSALRLLEDRQQYIDSMNQALRLGEESGEPRKVAKDDFKLRMKEKISNNDFQ